MPSKEPHPKADKDSHGIVEPIPIPQATAQEIQKLGTADIVLGIPSYDNADTIGHVVRMAQAGLERYFPSYKSAIINSDGGSKDGTPKQVLGSTAEQKPLLQVPYPVYPVNRLSTPYHGIPGKGSAFRMIFLLAQRLGAQACAVVDADLRSITPEWIDLLVRPILEGRFDFVAPYYQRHKYDGTITNSIVYPLTRALYGKRIRQPIGGDFAFSSRLTDHYLKQDVWNSDVARFGIDIWVTTQALCGDFQPCQAFLGAKIHDAKDPASDLSAMLAQVLGSLFTEMERNVAVWQKTTGSEEVPILGPRAEVSTEPVAVNVTRMVQGFRLGYETLQEIWGLVLPPATMLELKKLDQSPAEQFCFPDELWARTVYDFALGHRLRVMDLDHLLRALSPLYLGWLASFVRQMEYAGPEEVEDRLETLCLTYEAQKPYLIQRWR